VTATLEGWERSNLRCLLTVHYEQELMSRARFVRLESQLKLNLHSLQHLSNTWVNQRKEYSQVLMHTWKACLTDFPMAPIQVIALPTNPITGVLCGM